MSPVDDAAVAGPRPAAAPPAHARRGAGGCCCGRAQEQPLLLIFEDLHWIDGETQALLDGLVESLASARLLLLVNYRPEYRHGWGSKTYYSQLRLDPLPAESAGELLDALLGADPGSRRSSSFSSSAPRATRSSWRRGPHAGGDERAGRGQDGIGWPSRSRRIQVPATVQAMLAARIDRLPPEDKRLLQVASVVGKDVPFALLQAVAELPEEALRRELDAPAGRRVPLRDAPVSRPRVHLQARAHAVIVDESLRCVVLETLLALPEPGQRLARVAELRKDPGGGGDRMGKGEDDIPRPVRRDPVLDQWARLHPGTLVEVKPARGEVGLTDGVRVMTRLGEPEGLGRVLGRLGESAELDEASDRPVAIGDRSRCGGSEMLVDQVGGQRREVIGGQLDHPPVVTPVVVRLLEVGRGREAESQVAEALGNLQRASTGHKRLVQLAEQRVAVVMNAQTRPRRRSSFNRSARVSASDSRSSARRTSPSRDSIDRSSRRMSKPCSSMEGLSG